MPKVKTNSSAKKRFKVPALERSRIKRVLSVTSLLKNQKNVKEHLVMMGL